MCRKVRRLSPVSWAGGQSGSDFAIGSAPRTEAFLQEATHSVLVTNLLFLAVFFWFIRAQTVNGELNDNTLPV